MYSNCVSSVSTHTYLYNSNGIEGLEYWYNMQPASDMKNDVDHSLMEAIENTNPE
jgi:hypothetical protein